MRPSSIAKVVFTRAILPYYHFSGEMAVADLPRCRPLFRAGIGVGCRPPVAGPRDADQGPEQEAQVVLEVRHVDHAVDHDRDEREQHPEVVGTPSGRTLAPAPP